MAALSIFCERAWVDYSFETCIGLSTYIVPLVNPHIWWQQWLKTHIWWQQWLKTHSGGSESSLTQSSTLLEELEDVQYSK